MNARVKKNDNKSNLVRVMLKTVLLIYSLICLVILSLYLIPVKINWDNISKINETINNTTKQVADIFTDKIHVEEFGLTPREYYPEKKFIWNNIKSNTIYKYRIFGTLPADFDPKQYLTDYPGDAIEYSKRHMRVEVFTNFIDLNYFPEAKIEE